jgi:tyramine---L-glutamate ligase
MRRAIARDFAALDEGRARVSVTIDARLADDPGPWIVERIGPHDDADRILDLASQVDFTVLIAPETNGVLEGLTRSLRKSGTVLLGSSGLAVALAGNKVALAEWLARRDLDTPPCRVIDPREGLPRDATYPAVLKPCDGAGTIDTYFIEDSRSLPDLARGMSRAVLQPFVTGRPMSASFLIDAAGRGWLIGIGDQNVARKGGRFVYRGGRLPSKRCVDPRPLQKAVESVPGLRGFAGVDFIWDEDCQHATILEINPRPTTSIVGITRLLPPGRLALAWISACVPGSQGETFLPGLADWIDSQMPISFDVSGTVFTEGGQG